MSVGILKEAFIDPDLRCRLAEAEEGAGLPLDDAYEYWRAAALAREKGRKDWDLLTGVIIGVAAVVAVTRLIPDISRILQTRRSDPPDDQHRADPAAANTSPEISDTVFSVH